MTAQTPTKRKKGLILVVDDEPDLLDVLGLELEYSGFQVAKAENGRDAIDIMKKLTPDAVLSDIRMPNGDGVLLLDHLMEKAGGKPPLIFMSGFADLDEASAFERGAVGYYHKPVDGPVLAEALERAMVPPYQRWKLPATSSSNKRLKLSYPSYLEAKREGRFNLGRGGFFAACNMHGFFSGETVAFDVDVGTSNHLSGIGVIRWTRRVSTAGRPQGCGLEILSADGASQKFMEATLEDQPTRAFIPIR